MKIKIVFKLLILLAITLIVTNSNGQAPLVFDIPYGENNTVGNYVTINGAKIYYEEYGVGEPLLLIHANGGTIRSMGNQIDYFKHKNRVIVADNRGHGKSELKTDSLTYTQITKDWEGLVQHLNLDSLHIIGWSDGGIIGLKMGISNRVNIKKIVAMGANLRPDTTAVYSWAVNEVKRQVLLCDANLKKGAASAAWNLRKQHLGLLVNQPNIPTHDLAKIKAYVLIMAGDKDIIREQHTVELYQNIPNAQLCIMPGETHFTPSRNPMLFNEIAHNFIAKPFRRPDSDWTKKGR